MSYQPVDRPAALTMLLSLLDDEDARHLDATFQFAAAAHVGQLRDEGTPFIEHPVAVAVILWDELGCRDVDILSAALTHDILEDCDIDPAALQTLIGERAYALVSHVTKQQVANEEKAQRDAAYLEALGHANADARLLKLADRIHNLRSIPLSGDTAKAGRYLSISRDAFIPLALRTDPTAARLIEEACDAIEEYLMQAAN